MGPFLKMGATHGAKGQVCFGLIDICDEVWVYGDSEGCRKERGYAISIGKSVVIKYGKT
jgi:hypothetical protein